MRSNLKRWLIFGGIAVVGVVVVVAIAASSNQDSNPVPYIRDHYQRDVSLDEGDGGEAYTSPDAPNTVVSDLRSGTNEHDRGSAGGIDLLQYDNHIVAVSQHGDGSKIYVDDYRNGYRRYSNQYSSFALLGWSSSPPGAGGYRGGGSGGFGK